MNPTKSNIPEERLTRVGITGTGAADPTVRAGRGVTVARTGTGVYRYTFTKNPGTFVGISGPAFRADTASAVKGYTCTATPVTAATSTASAYIDVSIWNSSFAAANLEALQYLDITFVFAAQSTID
jgi:hypothetical protein